MHALQQPAGRPPQGAPPTPPTPQAPATPAPDAPVVAPGGMTEAQKEQLRQSIRDAVRSAREAGRVAREAGAAARAAGDAARAGQSPGQTVQIPPGDFSDFTPQMAKDLAENVFTGLFVTLVVLVLGSKVLRILGNRFGPPVQPAALPPQMAEQVAQIQHSIDAMAIEIERISESQRFLTKLQTGNAEAAALPRASSGT